MDKIKPTYITSKVNHWLWAGEYPVDRHEELATWKLRQFREIRDNPLHPPDRGRSVITMRSSAPGKDVCYTRFPITDQSVPKSLASVRELMRGIIKDYSREQRSV